MQPEKIAVFIDGTHLYAASRAAGFDVDYRNFYEFFSAKGQLVRPYYYTVLLDGEEYSPLKPLVDWLYYNGYTVITKLGREISDNEGRRRVRGSMDMDMLTDMFELAPSVDHIYLVSGNGDFRRPVEALQRLGVRVTVVSINKGGPTVVHDDLRRQADAYIDLADVGHHFTRPRKDATEVPGRPVRVPITATPADPFGSTVEERPRRRAAASA